MCFPYQVSFINYIVAPLWLELSSAFPFLKTVLPRLSENKARYSQLAESAKAEHASS
jgi:acyl carrier protein phosphodiesterase